MLFLVRTVDPNDIARPIPGVTIHNTGAAGEFTVQTDACGYYPLELGVPNQYNVVFSKPGYKSEPREWNLGDPPLKPILVGMTPDGSGGGGALPSRPTRDQMCGVRNQLQGISVGDHHLFDPEIGWSTDRNFRMAAYAAHRAVGDTHVCLSLDTTGLASLPQLKMVIREAITDGGMTGVLLMCMGDGNNPGEHDQDPGALGFGWLMANFSAIVDFMERNEDLTPYINFGPGFDGVVPAWQPFTRVNEFVRMARARLNRLTWGPGYLNVELAGGFTSWSGEQNDWATPDGQGFDTILQEFPIEWGPPDAPPAHLLTADGRDWAPTATNEQRNPWTQIWLMERLLGTRYIRPAMQPADYDPHPPYLLGGGTPRGRFFYIAWERTTFNWTRQNCDISLVNQQTQVVRELGAEFY